MTDTIRAAVFGLVGTLAGAVIGAAVTWYIGSKQIEAQQKQLRSTQEQVQEAERVSELARQEADALRQYFDAAPQRFVERFGTLIDDAAAAGAGTQTEAEPKLIASARAIVSQREALRGELGGLQQLLNSDLDLLAQELAKANPDHNKVREIVGTLKATWEPKRDEIALRIRRLMAALEFLLEPEPLSPSQ